MRTLARLQGAYFLATGVWSLVDIGSFQKVTGPKVDLWLVKTVGVLVAVIGGVLMLGARRPRPVPEVAVLATASAAALTGVDVRYVAKGRISPIYLLDAVVEVALVGAWLLSLRAERSRRRALPGQARLSRRGRSDASRPSA